MTRGDKGQVRVTSTLFPIFVISFFCIFVIGSWILELQERASDENPAGINRLDV